MAPIWSQRLPARMARSPCRPTSRAEPKGSGAGTTGERSCPHQPGSPTVASAVAIAGRAPVAATVPWNRSVPARRDVRRADRLNRPCPRAWGLEKPSSGRVQTGKTRLRRPVWPTTRAVRGGALRDGTHLIAAQLGLSLLFSNIFENIDRPAHFRIREYSREYRCPGWLFPQEYASFLQPWPLVTLDYQHILEYSRCFNLRVYKVLTGPSRNRCLYPQNTFFESK